MKILEIKRILLFPIAVFCLMWLVACNEGQKQSNQNDGLEPALSQLNQGIAIDSTDHTLYFARGEWYYKQQEYELAINDLERAIDLDPNIPEYYHLLSDTYMDNYRSKEAMEVMVKAGDQFGERIPTLLKLSETQYILKQYEPSLFTVAKILTIDNEHPEAYFMMGLNFRALDEVEKAINAFQTATELNPELVDAWLILGKLFENRNNDLALQYYEAAINVNPDMPETWHSKAFFLQNNGRIEDAIEVYRQINTIDRYYMDAYLNAGILYLEIDSLQPAYEQFNIMINLKSQNFIGHYYRGIVNEAMGNIEAAKTDFQNTLNLKPDYAKAQIALKRLESEG
ncbi:MAG: tetratricopeptide repeat protein [Saprospiraceae bacterium]|nr:tetratricopeptide repeat protein [Saprospiraceae bacterium]